MTILSPRAQAIFEKKYALDDKETWEQCVKRFCNLLTNDKKKQKQFFEFIYNMEGLPGGRALSNAENTNQLLNCFVLKIDDNIESICKTLTDFVKIETLGGGVGINFSDLRPKGAPIYRKGAIKNPKEKSCGSTGFMDIFHETAKTITGIGERKGATASVLNWRHQDALEFITMKKDHNKWNSFNISLAVDNEFFEKVKLGEKRESELWITCIEGMINDGEPGLLNLGLYSKYNAVEYLNGGKINCCNPCFELGLQDYGSCCLFSINLSTLPVLTHNDFYKELKNRVDLSVEIANLMLEKNEYILPENKEVAFKFRRIGVGIFGLAHYLIKNGVRYGSLESLDVISKLFETFRNLSYEASARLIDVFGQFKGFDADKYLANLFFVDFPQELLNLIRKNGMANCAINTCAPTGTISQLANTSSGVEPIFELAYKRTDTLGENEIKDSLYESDKYPKELFVTTNEITPEEHIAVQRTIQKYLDGSISKTINCLPNKGLHKKLDKLLLENMPYLKGITIYVKGSRKQEVLSSLKKEEMPNILPAIRSSHKIGNKKVYLFTSHLNSIPKEVFAMTGETEEVGAVEDAMCRLVSIMLRSGFSIQDIIKQLRKARGTSINTLPHIVANHLEEFTTIDEKCTICGGNVIKSEGCKICLKCGESKCS